MYCDQCGTQLASDSKFCGRCGSAVPPPPGQTTMATIAPEPPPPGQTTMAAIAPEPPPPPPPSAGDEQVLWVLSAQRKESFFARRPCYLIFTREKLVVAHLSAQRQKEESARVSAEIKEQGKGFLKGSVAMMQYWANYHTKYYSMTTAQIVAEDPTNMAIHYLNITKLVYQCQRTDIDADGSSYGHQGKLDVLLFDGKKIQFSHTNSHDNTVKNLLTQLFGNKLKYRK